MAAKNKLAWAMLALILVAGCGPAATVAPVSPAPTLTPAPSTATLTPPPATATAAPPTATPVAESSFDGVRVTWVFNAGFLITAGDRRVLIDAIYEGYPGGTLRPILESQPPFDGVDLILATHEHVDHFSPGLVRQYMLVNPNTVFASTPGAAGQLLALGDDLRDRVISLQVAAGESREFEANGIAVEAICLSHGIPRFLNLGFVITIGGATLFHTGDIEDDAMDVAYLQAYGLPDRRIDVAFVPQFFFVEEAYYALMAEGIGARYLIPMHFPGRFSPPASFTSAFPNYYIFGQSYESWVLPR